MLKILILKHYFEKNKLNNSIGLERKIIALDFSNNKLDLKNLLENEVETIFYYLEKNKPFSYMIEGEQLIFLILLKKYEFCFDFYKKEYPKFLSNFISFTFYFIFRNFC